MPLHRIPLLNIHEMPRSVLEAYIEAAESSLDAQRSGDSFNVTRALSLSINPIKVIMERAQLDKSWVNAHPIVTLYLSKLCSLNGLIDPTAFPYVQNNTYPVSEEAMSRPDLDSRCAYYIAIDQVEDIAKGIV